MAALHYMPLFVSDYLADAAHLTTQEHGAYLLLIMTYWQRGEALPADDNRLARIARITRQEWDGMRDTLAEFFDVGNDTWGHAKIEQVLADVRAKSEKARSAGKASAERRNAGRSTDAEQTLNERSTDVQPIKEKENKREEEEKKENVGSDEPTCPVAAPKRVRNAYPEDFDRFWDGYPKTPTMSKKETFDAWKRVSTEEQEKAVAALPAFRAYCAAKPDYPVVHACRFLSKQRADGFLNQPTVLPFAQPATRNHGASNAALQHILNRSAAREAAGGVEILPPARGGF